MKYISTIRLRLIVLLTLLLTLHLGYQQHTQENSQVIATVNREEITVHQLNSATIDHLYHSSPYSIDKNLLLDKLIEDTLLKQALNKSEWEQPMIVQSLTNAIIRAYADVYRRLFLNVAIKPTDLQIAEYLKKHPELFEQRQLFEIFEITFNSNVSIEDINFLAYHADSFSALKVWIKKHPIDTYHHTTFVTTEKLRPEFFKHGFRESGNALIFFTDENGYKRLQLATPVKFVPIIGNDAFMIARENVIKDLRNQRLEHEISRLKAIASIKISTPS